MQTPRPCDISADGTLDDSPPRAARQRQRPRWFTNERTVAGVMSALAAYFVYRSETRPPAVTERPDIAPLVASVEKLETDVLRVEGKVDSIQDKVGGIKDAVTLLQVSASNNDFRLQRVEAETASIKARRQ